MHLFPGLSGEGAHRRNSHLSLAGTILKSYSVALRKSGRKDDAREAERRGREIEQRAGVRPGATVDVSELMRSR